MEVLAVMGAWAVTRLCTTLPPINNSIVNTVCGRGDIVSILEPRLSNNAHIIFSNSTGFAEATSRWSLYSAPSVSAVVQVATENDVAETVKYANANGYPFFAKSGGHGAVTSLGEIQNGIEIWMNQLDTITISTEGDTATFGGGVLSKQVTDTLWASRKQTVTGGCECTGLLGVGLGGGHGFLQGKYGLVSDQFVSMRVVLADGRAETVSAQSRPDLWWAMQGAGQNFGIVTSVTSKIYDIEDDSDSWSYEGYVFMHDKVEGIFETINQLWENETDVINFSVVQRIPEIDPENPVILLYLLKQGKPGLESGFTTAFRNLDPISIKSATGTLRDIPKWTGLDIDSPVCQIMGIASIAFPVNIQSYNIPTQRAVFDAFAHITAEIPQFGYSFMMFEGYTLQGVKAISAESTAYPHRDDDILVAPIMVYKPDPSLDDAARRFGSTLRGVIQQASGSSELHAYVNYAVGDEGPQSWYGYETWRLERLRELKKKYDPKGRFNFHAPVE